MGEEEKKWLEKELGKELPEISGARTNLVEYDAMSQPIQRNWFKRHLNLTWLFGLLGLCFFVAILETFLGMAFLGKGNNGTYFICWTMLPVNGWVLKQKGRSLHWLWLALFFPIISLILSNKKSHKSQSTLTNPVQLQRDEDQPK